METRKKAQRKTKKCWIDKILQDLERSEIIEWERDYYRTVTTKTLIKL